MEILTVENLRTYYLTFRESVKAVDDVSFSVNKGEIVGLAGESGSGKSTVAMSILRILPPGGVIVGGKIRFNDRDLLSMSEEKLRELRWKKISLVTQGSMNAFDPVVRVGKQIEEAIATHEHVSEQEAWEKTKELFNLVGLDPSRVRDYPHEFSGGMKQRAMIAMALACNPELIIVDEPTTALDVIIQAKILNLLFDLQKKLKLSVIMITHNLSLISAMCDKCAIMYAGKIMEFGTMESIFCNPMHKYTQLLMRAVPSIKGTRKDLVSIEGSPPDLANPPTGCRFHPRCPYAEEVCMEVEPELVETQLGHYVACHKSDH